VQLLLKTSCGQTFVCVASLSVYNAIKRRITYFHQHQSDAEHGWQTTYVLQVVLAAGLDKVHSAHEVVRVVQHRRLHALANGLSARKVDDSIEPACPLQQTLYPLNAKGTCRKISTGRQGLKLNEAY
jgi:hypothetical protein